MRNFLGTITSTVAPLAIKSFLVCLTSLCPSVETATVLSSFICNKTPVSAGFSSSRLIANEVELIISGGYEERQKEIEEGQRVMFDMALKQLKNTKFYELALKEFTLWDIEKTTYDIGGDQEKIEKMKLHSR